MKFNIITIFPELITDYCGGSILGRAQKKNLIKINAMNLRDFANDKHKTVDDTPYGGGPGMVMRADVIARALGSLGVLKKNGERRKEKKRRVILLSPRGKQFDQALAEQFAKLNELVLISGRYEGIDQRVHDKMIDEEISVGPYVLAGGELGALVILEATARLIPGVLGNEESLKEETTVAAKEYPQYTRPEIFNKWKVPEILLGGHHKKIGEWRRKMQK
ncbi:MAG: tRNA (guanosine(37)-N1)-methyltransferase TrmD [Patescibacteria group bacterium]